MKSATSEASATPVMKQYLAIKAKHADALLFFRMGDFYELFYEDAIIAARALDLTLTSRNKGVKEEIPMAGVPYHAASSYVQRLLDTGHKVAICEQMADPTKVKGIVPREVVRIVSPGVVFDEAGLKANQNHYFLAIEKGPQGIWGVAAFDLTTGELIACELSDREDVLAEVIRLDPREVFLGNDSHELGIEIENACPRRVVRYEKNGLTLDSVYRLLGYVPAQQCERVTWSHSVQHAVARCIHVACTSEPGKPPPIASFQVYQASQTLLLDQTAQRHLELVQTMGGEYQDSLLSQIDLTQTAPGARLLRKRLLAPLTSVSAIHSHHNAVELFFEHSDLRREIRERLSRLSDLERLAVKLSTRRLHPRDLVGLLASLQELPSLVRAFEACPSPHARRSLGVPSEGAWLDRCEEVEALLRRALMDEPSPRLGEGLILREGYDQELDEARLLARDGQRLMIDLEARLRAEFQILSLKVRYTRVFGWYLEVTRVHLDKVPKAWRRKQTIATGERFTCRELDELADRLAHAEERCASRESELYHALIEMVAQHESRFRQLASQLAAWDVASSLAEVAHCRDYIRPEVDESLQLILEGSRHPVVERFTGVGGFVPNHIRLEAGGEGPEEGLEGHQQAHLWLITGPNMAGKSTLMRQAALCVILAQMGSFVPAKRAKIGIVDRILTRVGASDNVACGESTFMVEMKETAHVLQTATRRSLVILDEIGRGTSTYDGLSIAWAVAEYLHDVTRCRALFATHYYELTRLSKTKQGCQNWSVSAQEHKKEVIFLHQLQPGPASRSYGIECARLAGIPESVLSRASTILKELEEEASGMRPLARDAKAEECSPPAEEILKREEASLLLYSILEELKAVDLNQMTPLEAFQWIACSKKRYLT
ncbi:DNA mismatch repair protein MutS [Pajaroellobacter abortibovis]|uniref:DNA mismatch repair protein MutS n=1 Tax=Pajaroellobacter abortibovis TaxID=1882918 RepID=A0A1L6MV64_9BACT|nr:DNA mismatch repair protein MutS [Pajaroellobacter abortibovis]APR99408.1 DNA mismatch repair protein MutS [Pajaroellobacter abortibovis]